MSTRMRRRVTCTLACVMLLLSLAVWKVVGCQWAVGYFYQVTVLRGTVVGSNFPILHLFRLYRLSASRPNAKLSLYDYCSPCDIRARAAVKSVIADGDGKYDFGSLKAGHYVLFIEEDNGELADQFSVEIVKTPNARESQTIDISPVHPDCSGGHEFIVNTS